jgi:hypothetical protein
LSLHLYDVTTLCFNRYFEAEFEDEVRKIDYSEKPRIIVPATPPSSACVRQQTSAARGTRPDRGVRRQL